jgi:hypothetical protein
VSTSIIGGYLPEVCDVLVIEEPLESRGTGVDQRTLRRVTRFWKLDRAALFKLLRCGKHAAQGFFHHGVHAAVLPCGKRLGLTEYVLVDSERSALQHVLRVAG